MPQQIFRIHNAKPVIRRIILSENVKINFLSNMSLLNYEKAIFFNDNFISNFLYALAYTNIGQTIYLAQ